MKLHVSKGGIAWRGYIPFGGEKSKGEIDHKEGLYLGPEHDKNDPRVLAGLPLHGANQLPDDSVPELRPVVADYVEYLTDLGLNIMRLMSLALGLDQEKCCQIIVLKNVVKE